MGKKTDEETPAAERKRTRRFMDKGLEFTSVLSPEGAVLTPVSEEEPKPEE